MFRMCTYTKKAWESVSCLSMPDTGLRIASPNHWISNAVSPRRYGYKVFLYENATGHTRIKTDVYHKLVYTKGYKRTTQTSFVAVVLGRGLKLRSSCPTQTNVVKTSIL